METSGGLFCSMWPAFSLSQILHPWLASAHYTNFSAGPGLGSRSYSYSLLDRHVGLKLSHTRALIRGLETVMPLSSCLVTASHPGGATGTLLSLVKNQSKQMFIRL